MKTTTPSNSANPMLRWIFCRAGRALTCEIDTQGAHTFEVSLVPHWNISATVIERFDRLVGAMEHHASLARTLRAQGWTLVDYAANEAVAA